MGYLLDNCPTVHRCCNSMPLRVSVLVIAVLGLLWAGLFFFGFTGPGRRLLQEGASEQLVRVVSHVLGAMGVLLFAVHVLLFFGAACESYTLCEIYIWFMIIFWAVMVIVAIVTAVAAILKSKILFACLFLLLTLVLVLISFYFTIVVANYKMTLP